MAEIDWQGFASIVSARLRRDGLSIRAAVARWPETNVALWSRAARGRQPLSAENFLLLCRILRVSPWRFWSVHAGTQPAGSPKRTTLRAIRKRMQKQSVSVCAKRETLEPRA
ncbi:hypothetical protein [Mesorhizobium sp. CAU 1741]|uniref:hypothetical protein n=1 Tax=Mesorhizobium sp. CAU 1741 TaxID=3140366 RepID=UPI00325BBFDC